ncbi:MAG: GNAT family N-acetyltransferase [Candidatus Neoclostridium sp.]
MSKTYRVRKLTSADTDEVFALCEKNALYYEYHPPFVKKSDVEEDMRALPPGKSACDKYYVGFFDESGLIAVADVIAGYPDEQTAFIGFFMTDVRVQRKGTGSAIISELCDFLKREDFRLVRLAYVKENPQARGFWLKNGFVPTGEVFVKPDYTLAAACKSLNRR